ncbi:hypothetical protein AVEN_185480-1 [Araneus ventricosus]|uniref:Uncharacterized protein n=1 Tax=Araneus ventricosus TaxID=182803 RepID=A0A4Y2GZN9_ARAVE|nr:hypothetical protein AVEN_185480-1 [Araneus ventricosus]
MDPLWQRHLTKEKNHLLRRGPSTPDLSKSPFTSFDDVQHPKKKPKNSLRLSSPSNQKARFPTSQAATSLPSRTFSKVPDQIFRHLTAKLRHPLVFSLQRDSAVFHRGHASRRNEDPLEQGKGKRNTFHLPCFFISWHKQILISHTQEFKTI